MSLLEYWPSLDEIDNCIKAEAENASDEVLLAVHQKFPLVYLKVGADGKTVPESRTVANEDDLLTHLLGKAPSGTHVIPITGASGVGKSHLIRILDARLRQLPDADRYLVIRIPKSASLRRAVELILNADPLLDSKYDQVKSEFKKALADVPLDQQVLRFQAELEIALSEYSAVRRELIGREPSNSHAKECLGHSEKLPMLMSDAETVEHFRINVLPRIIQRSVKGAEFEQGEIKEIDSVAAQFNVSDFDLSAIDMGSANIKVSTYYKLALVASEGKGKKVAVQVLNDVANQATSQLYQLNQSLGGMTLAEVILEIRRILLLDKKELIILVEDFAALVGIQDTLAKVLIQEGTTSNGKEFATIRSVIAVTDGYLAGRDTLATRAGREWQVESRLETEDDVIKRTKLLVASYLNAARYGEDGLKKYYRKFIEGKSPSDPWCAPPIFSNESGECGGILKAFGYLGEVPLFPFTELAIEQLARGTLKSGNALVFNPRYVIKNVIRELLVLGRSSYFDNQFPPLTLSSKVPFTEISQWITSKGLAEVKKRRYEILVMVWGNDPKTQSEVGRIPKEVFETFGLPVLDIDFKPLPVVAGTSSEISGPPKIAEVTSRQNTQIVGYQTTLEKWVQDGIALDQTFANKIRQAIANAINQNIDWNAERCLKRPIKFDQISIPNAKGQLGLSTAAIKIAMDSQDPNGRLRGDLIALLRHIDVYGEKTDYDGAEDDMARVANLVQRLLPDALDIIRLSVEKQNQAMLLALVMNSWVLGLNEGGRSLNRISTFLFNDTAQLDTLPDTAPESFKNWRVLQGDAEKIRPMLWGKLLETNGCFQGTGDTVRGVDIVRILMNFPENISSVEFDFGSELKQYLLPMKEQNILARINRVLQDTTRIQKEIIAKLGDEFDKQAVFSELTELAGTLTNMGAWNNNEIGFTSNHFKSISESFRSSALTESLSILQNISEADLNDQSPSKKIIRTAQLPLFPLLAVEQFMVSSEKVILAASKHAGSLEEQYRGVTPDEKVLEIVDIFKNLTHDLAVLQTGGK